MRKILLAVLLVSSAAAEPAPYHPPAMPRAARGALLPWSRIVTYYGNPLSTRMGILGELPPEQMMAGLAAEAEAWRKADPHTRVLPGLELVATVAADIRLSGLYRTRMPDALIDKVVGWARSKGWLVILDVQVGHASVKDEVERLKPWLESPDVHLALDPEFDMPEGIKPGKRIGTTDEMSKVNVAIRLLAAMIESKKLPPKLLLVHRFTGGMLTNSAQVKLDPRVQVVMVMDGYGSPAFKRTAYRIAIRHDPVEFAGIKLFYKNDVPRMTPKEALAAQPGPSVLIYQ